MCSKHSVCSYSTWANIGNINGGFSPVAFEECSGEPSGGLK